ncbi:MULTISPECIES: ParA family protein [Ruminobacter]|uniref:ParA family protein n=1 Tax=Ruminobacter TaxID=866 RepID=UPI0038680087
MTKIVTFIAEKGGTSRSSVVFSSSWLLAAKGKKVLIIDMDGQAANVSYYAGVNKTPDMHTLVDLFKGVDIKDTIVNIKENLDIIPANAELTNLGQTAKLSVLKKAVRSIPEYDYVFIDVNPTPGWTHFLSLSVSDSAIIVSLPDVACLKANEGILESIDEIQNSSNPNLELLGILFGKNENRTSMAQQVHEFAESMAQRAGTTVFNASIRNSVVMGELVAAHKGISDYAPKSPVAGDFDEFVHELLAKIE